MGDAELLQSIQQAECVVKQLLKFFDRMETVIKHNHKIVPMPSSPCIADITGLAHSSSYNLFNALRSMASINVSAREFYTGVAVASPSPAPVPPPCPLCPDLRFTGEVNRLAYQAAHQLFASLRRLESIRLKGKEYYANPINQKPEKPSPPPAPPPAPSDAWTQSLIMYAEVIASPARGEDETCEEDKV